MATLNVQDFGAAGDGVTADTQAIRDAIAAATDGDDIYFPSGEYPVSSDGSGGNIFILPEHVSNLTFRGDSGYNTSRIFIDGDSYGPDVVFTLFLYLSSDNPAPGYKFKDLTLDGNSPSSTSTRTQAIRLKDGQGGGHDFVVEDCYLENFTAVGVVFREGGPNVVCRRVTSVNNEQNFAASERGDWSYQNGANFGIEFEHCVSKDATLVGLDHNQGGQVHIDYFYSENNTNGTFKSTNDNRRTVIENATINNTANKGIRTQIASTGPLPDPPLIIEANNVAIRNGDIGGAYMSGDDSSVHNSQLVGGPIEVRNNAVGDRGQFGGVQIHSAAGGNLTELRVIDTANGPGVNYNGNYDLSIDTYYHQGNDGGAVADRGDGTLSIGSQHNSDPGRLDTPAESEVGAWSGATESGSGSGSDETSTSAAASIETAGGTLLAAGGAIQTSEPATSGFSVVDGFEEYTAGTQLHNTSPWNGAGSWNTNFEVTSTAAAVGDQSLLLTGPYNYNGVQSHEGSGLATYPAADCTIRIATYLTGGFHDIAFAVPTAETDFNDNCYRIRGGPDYSGNPIVRRTVDGSSDALATLDTDFPTNTWIEHVIEFETTGSEVVLTYHGYEWDGTDQTWRQFASGVEGIDTDNNFPDERGVGLGTYRVSDDAVWFDEIRVGDLGTTAPPDWTPVTESP
jgi:hypothetical protein